MRQFLDLLDRVIYDGDDRGDRTGTGTRSVFGAQMRFNLAEGFPLVTTRKIFLKSVVHELLWFLNGDTNLAYLHEHDVHIWDDWADEKGDLGPIYPSQWRHWEGQSLRYFGEGIGYAMMGVVVDQVNDLLSGLRERPFSRRHIVSSWNPVDLPDEKLSPQANVKHGLMALAPCHALFQFYVSSDRRLSCQLYQRSADLVLGVPYNLASYALLTQMVAQQTDLDVGDLVWTGGDVHVYANHREQAEIQRRRIPRALPKLFILRKPDSLFDYRFEDFELVGYDPHAPLDLPRAV